MPVQRLKAIGGPLDGEIIECDPNLGDTQRLSYKGGFTTYIVKLVGHDGGRRVFGLYHYDSQPVPGFVPPSKPEEI